MNLNIPIALGDKMYKAYKELYPDVFKWGEANLERAINNGYIETLYGFKYYLPEIDSFRQYDEERKKIDWTKYSDGKKEFLARNKSSETGVEHEEGKEVELRYYNSVKGLVGKHASLRSGYFNNSLNFPIQSSAAFMTKGAMIKLFQYILDHNHVHIVKICNFIYDEIIIEVPDDLADEYREVLENAMCDSGAFFVKHDKEIKITGTANIGPTWYSTK